MHLVKPLVREMPFQSIGSWALALRGQLGLREQLFRDVEVIGGRHSTLSHYSPRLIVAFMKPQGGAKYHRKVNDRTTLPP